MYKAAMVVAPETVGITEYELPPLSPTQVRVKAEFGSAKHGTELAFIKGYGGARGRFDKELGLLIKSDAPPGPFRPGGIGNMFVGIVTGVGGEVKDLAVGDRVLSYGGFRQAHNAEAGRCWKMPAGLSWKSAVCLDPADYAMAAVRDGHVRIGDAVAIFGLGAIGLMVLQLCKISGASPVIAVDPLPNRRAAAMNCGADFVLDPTACDAGLEIKKATAKRGVDVAIEYSGNVRALQAAIRGAAFGGTVVAGAFPGPYPPGLDLGAESHQNIPTIIFSRACSEPNRDHPRWSEKRIYETCWRLICEGRLSGEHVVAPVVPFESLPTEFMKIATEPQSNIKLGVQF
jgi:threonine dehydrogenase-like Zn-dependent dehydrogenase